MTGPQIAWLPDGKRLHMNHGPIDLIVEGFGEPDEVRAAYEQAASRFQTILQELVDELPALRRQSSDLPRAFAGPTARRMELAACRFADRFVTPMAAVAGAVADEMLAALSAGRQLERAYVNDGGDIAIHLAHGQSMTAAIGGKGDGFADRAVIRHSDSVRGVAASGWRGRSFSLGIADAVTVLAADAATADVAATLIANAVDLPGHPAIRRQPANAMQPDTDLGDRPVTVDVGPLSRADVATALEAGAEFARQLQARGSIAAAALFLAGEARIVGDVRASAVARSNTLEPAHA